MNRSCICLSNICKKKYTKPNLLNQNPLWRIKKQNKHKCYLQCSVGSDFSQESEHISYSQFYFCQLSLCTLWKFTIVVAESSYFSISCEPDSVLYKGIKISFISRSHIYNLHRNKDFTHFILCWNAVKELMMFQVSLQKGHHHQYREVLKLDSPYLMARSKQWRLYQSGHRHFIKKQMFSCSDGFTFFLRIKPLYIYIPVEDKQRSKCCTFLRKTLWFFHLLRVPCLRAIQETTLSKPKMILVWVRDKRESCKL